jgi:predicted HNH restriction endonuclease
MIELYPGSYFSCDTINKNKAEGRLNVWRGFDVTVTVYNKFSTCRWIPAQECYEMSLSWKLWRQIGEYLDLNR